MDPTKRKKRKQSISRTKGSPSQLQESYVTLKRRVETPTREMREPLEQQGETSEIPDLISRLPTDVQPVYRAILANVTPLCEADIARLFLYHRRLLQEIEEKNKQLETANKHKSQFLANVSHELRTPLNSIMGFTRIVMRRTEGQIAELQKENLQKVLLSSEHLLGLINSLLDLAKIEAGRMEVFTETFSFDDIIRSAISTVDPMLKNGRVRLVTEMASDIPLLKTDRDKLKQVVLNLLSNAVKFTEKGEIRVAARQDAGKLKIEVADTGIGIKKETLRRIFDNFHQADMSTTRKYGGTGLGLAIAKKFTHLMGGEITVQSEVGKGSKFTITLPLEMERDARGKGEGVRSKK